MTCAYCGIEITTEDDRVLTVGEDHYCNTEHPKLDGAYCGFNWCDGTCPSTDDCKKGYDRWHESPPTMPNGEEVE